MLFLKIILLLETKSVLIVFINFFEYICKIKTAVSINFNIIKLYIFYIDKNEFNR
jgi:hypothetical protein